MNPEMRLKLIATIVTNDTWGAILLVGRAILDRYYPASVFDGSSGDSGPDFIVALREAIKRIDEIDKARQQDAMREAIRQQEGEVP